MKQNDNDSNYLTNRKFFEIRPKYQVKPIIFAGGPVVFKEPTLHQLFYHYYCTVLLQTFNMPSSLNVAVIGAGVGGLLAGRELLRAGHRVTIFEKQNQLGGTWVYDPRVESDLLSLDPDREIIQNSLYSSLRTNLPRHLMGFSDFSFTKIYDDSRIFPSHEEVLKFLNDFALHFGVSELIRLSTEVVRVEAMNDEWFVESRSGETTQEEVFDAVVVCNGMFTEPRVANFPGIVF